MPKLSQFRVRPDGEDFIMEIEDEQGQTLKISATAEQLDTIIDALDDILSENEEEAFEVGGGQTYQKPLG